MDHRTPPLRFSDAPRGVCRFCGDEILKRLGSGEIKSDRRRRWHNRCLEVYKVAHWGDVRRWAVRQRDGGLCAVCGAADKPWEVDHEYPLHLVDRSDPFAMRFWMMANLVTLCCDCHKEKSAKEAAARAKIVRLRRKFGHPRGHSSEPQLQRADIPF